MHGRNEELSRVNSDLLNLLGSVQIAIVIVSSDLRIRRFTPMSEKVLNLIPADLDRSIGHIKPNLDDVNLEQLITECIDGIVPIEREVRDREGRWYSLRIRPYRSIENRIDGAVLSLFDIDAPKRSEEIMRTAVAFADVVLQASSTPMAVLDQALCVKAANDPFIELLSIAHDDVRGKPLAEMVQADAGLEPLRELTRTDGSLGSRQIELQLMDGGRRLRAQARAFSSYDAPAKRAVLLTASAETAAPAES
jgi:two-component system CheB/CheR fusion protein